MSDQTETRPGFVRRALAAISAKPTSPIDPDPSPVMAAVLASIQRAAAMREELASREWTVAFADAVRVGDVINIPHSGISGLALRVLEIRRHGECEGCEEAVTFLAVDVTDASQPFSPTLSVHMAVRVAVAAPDSLAGLTGGAA